MFIIDKAMKLHNQRDNLKFAENYEKDYFKKMKKKMFDKKKMKRDTNNGKLQSLLN